MPDEEEVEIPYLWLSDEDWEKLQRHTRFQINAILHPLRIYGQDIFVDGATEELMTLFDLYGQVVRGKDIPVMVRGEPALSPMD